MVAVLALLCAAAGAAAPAPVTVDVDPSVISAARALGPSVMFFTARAHPLTSLAQLRDPATEVGSGDVEGAKDIQAVLRAGGVKVGGGAVDLLRLYTAHHFASLFRAHPTLRLFVVRARPDGRERLILDGGGVRVQLRARGQLTGALESKPLAAPASFVTSFGPIASVTVAANARQRTFDARDGAHVETRAAKPGHTFIVVHLQRDFHMGTGLVSFLFGSGIVMTPAFNQLTLFDGHAAHPPTAIFAEGTTVELGYEVPADSRGWTLRDGDDACPVAPYLATKQTARD